jgi:hypothetical protein
LLIEHFDVIEQLHPGCAAAVEAIPQLAILFPELRQLGTLLGRQAGAAVAIP